MSFNTLYLCATSRLAQTLRQHNLPGSHGQTNLWRTPQALTLDQWQAQCAEALLLSGELDLPPALSAESERLLWEIVLASALGEENGSALFDLPGLAEEAQAAHALCIHWDLPLTSHSLAGSDEGRAFVRWQQSFLERCKKLQRLSAADQLRALVERIGAGHVQLPEHIVFAGFDRFTALEKMLIAAFEARACTVTYADFTLPHEAQIRHRHYPDRLAECHAAVAWASAYLADKPEARLAIVTPDLAAVRSPLSHLLDAALHPLSLRPDSAAMARSYNLSLGEALAQQPLIATALALLRLLGRGREQVAQDELSALLLSAFWAGDDSEADARALADARLRRNQPSTTTWQKVWRHLGEAHCPLSLHALRTARMNAQTLAGKQTPSQWAHSFQTLLQSAGWPGERTLNSVEFQAQNAFLQLCGEFAEYDELLGPIRFSAALQRLSERCRKRLFQPQTLGTPRIQVLGVLESAGLQFDALWFLGMNDDRWPPPARLNALLPAAIQQEAGSNRASASVELSFARQVQKRLLRAAPQITLSWAENDGNRILRPSPLLQAEEAKENAEPLAHTERADPVRVITLAAARAACTPLARLNDAKAPGLAAGELLEGGSGVLRAQALCPAWAYYRYRLGATALEAPVDGLDSRLRGSLVHLALQHFWESTRDQDRLRAQDESTRHEILAAAIENALNDFAAHDDTPLPANFRRLEAARLQRLLLRWLKLEDERPSAFTVLSCEEEKTLAVGNLRIRVVIDRVDQLADGSCAVLDYKTGKVETHSWVDARISEPQLPLYAAFGDTPMACVSFARVVLDEPGFSGVSAVPEQLPKVMAVNHEKNKPYLQSGLDNWPALLAHWRDSICELAAEIEHGAAAVVFADENALAYCEVTPLLRLAERRRLWQEASGWEASDA
ncbi:PD-(D/E)XK nuclease family protein [Azonexus sp.]|uniref:PD-(D/E)XK nuclease family protein n=1 Tax=Azonexus sp. TaxID=1872668 RepID=UPI0039E694D0